MNIGRLARWYRLIEYCAFGKALERRRFAYLSKLADAGRILILGEGDGRLLHRLLSAAPCAAIDVVELSPEMIGLARARIADSSRVRFVRGDARLVDFSTYDGLVTCFFLDCFDQADARMLVNRLASALTPGGIWLVSDFEIPSHGWGRWHAAVWMWVMYRFFRIATGLHTQQLPPTGELLISAGLTCVARETERVGMIVSEVWTKPPNSGRP